MILRDLPIPWKAGAVTCTEDGLREEGRLFNRKMGRFKGTGAMILESSHQNLEDSTSRACIHTYHSSTNQGPISYLVVSFIVFCLFRATLFPRISLWLQNTLSSTHHFCNKSCRLISELLDFLLSLAPSFSDVTCSPGSSSSWPLWSYMDSPFSLNPSVKD